MNQLCTIFV